MPRTRTRPPDAPTLDTAGPADPPAARDLAEIAHDMRGSLTTLANAAQLVRLVAPGDPRLADVAAMISRQVQRLTQLADELAPDYR
jgi:nitrogen-specific signal transduction histidine kinase